MPDSICIGLLTFWGISHLKTQPFNIMSYKITSYFKNRVLNIWSKKKINNISKMTSYLVFLNQNNLINCFSNLIYSVYVHIVTTARILTLCQDLRAKGQGYIFG